MDSLLVNFSGHPLNERAREELSGLYDFLVDSRPLDIDFDADVGVQIEAAVKALGVRIDGSSSVTIIPPGQATFAILLVSYIHGLIGHFPNICYMARCENGLYLPSVEYEIQPQKIRNAGRKFRVSRSDE